MRKLSQTLINPSPTTVTPTTVEQSETGINAVSVFSNEEQISNIQNMFVTKPSISSNSINSNLIFDKSRQNSIENGWRDSHAQDGRELRGDSNELFLSLRNFFIFGKYIGCLPWKGLHQKDARKLMKDKSKMQWAVSVTITVSCAICTSIMALNMLRSNPRTAVDYAKAPGNILYHGLALFNFVFFYTNSSKFIEIIQEWRHMEIKLYYTKADKRLRYYVIAVAALTMTSAILENITGELKLFLPYFLPSKYGNRVNLGDVTLLELYYRGYHQAWTNLVPYHPVTAVFLWIHNKITVYAWNFRDLTLIVFARAIYFRFKTLYQEASADLDIASSVNSSDSDPQKWRQLAVDHAVLCKMLDKIVKLFSPLVFWSYAANIYFTLIHVHGALTPKTGESVIGTFYAQWSFFHLVVRLTIVTLMSSKIHEWAHKAEELFRKCPREAVSIEVVRTERCLGMGTIGFTGLGCFRVTRPLLLRIIGVIFSFEIVLLQQPHQIVESHHFTLTI